LQANGQTKNVTCSSEVTAVSSLELN